MLHAAARPPRQSFADGPSTVFCGHQALLDAYTFFQKHMANGCQAIRGA